ncbi:MAG: hypothetical protein FJ265_19355 [Planctomycetes bacterium]|nr:hypothetical protein [Planctomycetota bacterium]
MTDPKTTQRVIRRDAVRLVPQPALVACGGGPGAGQGPIAVVPLLDGEAVAGFEIRCSCGATALVECIYPPGEPR